MTEQPGDTSTMAEAGLEARQEEMPFAIVQGEAYTDIPKDLYIPPDALEIILEAFEGPLDFLLYLIRRQNLDIRAIPIASITDQYMEYIELMRELRFELAAEYLLMAAMLCEIKSRVLLPRPAVEEDEDEEDPRAELIRRLQEYERYKQAAEDIDALPRLGRDFVTAEAYAGERKVVKLPPETTLKELVLAFKDVVKRAELFRHHHVQREALSVRQRMSQVLTRLGPRGYTQFEQLFAPQEGRAGVVVTFMAILELLKAELVEIVQNEPYARIYVKSLSAASSEEVS